MDKINRILFTKLRFHRVYTSFLIPLSIFMNAFSLIENFFIADLRDPLLWISTVLGAGVIVLSVIEVKGLKTFKRSGLICLFIVQGLSIASSVFNFVILFMTPMRYFSMAYLFSIIWSVIVLVYYIKRRKLFTKEGVTEDDLKTMKERIQNMATHGVRINPDGTPDVNDGPIEEVHVVEEVPEIETVEAEKEDIKEYYCPRCGYHITDGAVFCPKCGSQTRKVNS